jgi:hypothetical protein
MAWRFAAFCGRLQDPTAGGFLGALEANARD